MKAILRYRYPPRDEFLKRERPDEYRIVPIPNSADLSHSEAKKVAKEMAEMQEVAYGVDGGCHLMITVHKILQ